jgi:hypothetical protein
MMRAGRSCLPHWYLDARDDDAAVSTDRRLEARDAALSGG